MLNKIIKTKREDLNGYYLISPIFGVVGVLLIGYYTSLEEIKKDLPAIYVGYITVLVALVASLFATLTFFNGALKTRTDAELNKDGSLDDIVKSIIEERANIIKFICILASITIFFLLYGLFENNKMPDDCRLSVFSSSSFLFITIIIYCIIFFTNNTNTDNLILKKAEKQLAENGKKIEDIIKENIIETSKKITKDDFLNKYEEIKKQLSKDTDANSLLTIGIDFFKLAYYRIINGLERKERDDYIKYCNEKLNDSQQFLKLAFRMEQYVDVILHQNILADDIAKKKYKESFKWLYTRDKMFEDIFELKKNYHKTLLGKSNERRYIDALIDMEILNNSAKESPVPYIPNGNRIQNPKYYNSQPWKFKYQKIENYRILEKTTNNKNKDLTSSIETFFDYYEKIINYRNAFKWVVLLEAKKETKSENKEEAKKVEKNDLYPYILAEILHRVLFDKYASNVKLNKINMGSSDFSKAWLNYSDLSDSNFHNSNFKFAHLYNTTLKRCDLSVSNFYLADAKYANFTDSNLSDSSFVGTFLDNSNLTNCNLEGVIFRNPFIDTLSKTRKKKSYILYDRLDKKLKSIKSELEKNHSKDKLLNSIDEIKAYKNCVVAPKGFKEIKDKLKNETFDEHFEIDEAKKIIMFYKKNYENIYNKNLVIYLTSVASLKQATINKVSLRGVDLSYTNLTGASFNDSILTGAQFHYSKGMSADFSNANLSGNAIFNETKLTSAVLKNVNLFGAVFIDCNCETSTFKSSNLVNAIILGEFNGIFVIELNEKDVFNIKSKFSDTNLSEIDAINLRIYNTNLERAIINKSKLRNAIFVNNSFRYADLSQKTDMTYSFLYKNTFYQANLNSVILIDAKIKECKFEQASLEKSLMLRADIIATTFDFANLSGANLSDAKIENSVFKDCTFDTINFIKSLFKKCEFQNISIKNEIGIAENTFLDCDFIDVIFSDEGLKTKIGKNNRIN